MKYWNLFKPFSAEVWITFAIVYIIAASLFWAMVSVSKKYDYLAREHNIYILFFGIVFAEER